MRSINFQHRAAQLTASLFVAACLALSGCSTGSMSARGSKPEKSAGTSAQKAAQKPKDERVDATTQREFDRALGMIRDGHPADAETPLLGLTRTQPTFSGPYANLGIVYYQTQRYDEAQKYLEKAASLNPGNPAVYNYLGLVHRQTGRFQDALAAYEKALQQDPNYAAAHLNMGILLDLYLQSPEQALPHYQKYRELVGGKDKQVDAWIADIEKRTKSAQQTSKGEAR